MKSMKQMYKEVGRFLGPEVKYSVELDYASWWNGEGHYRLYVAAEGPFHRSIHVGSPNFEKAFNELKEKVYAIRHSEGSSRTPEDVCRASADQD